MKKEIFKYSRPANSALFHAVKGMIFMGDRYACKVYALHDDFNDANLKINNEKRLKDILFDEIIKLFNARKDFYGLSYSNISKERNRLEIKKFKFVRDEKKDFSGKYMVYPRTFVCSICGDFRNIKQNEWENFDPNKCKNKDCSGYYEQVSILMFCPDCGKITPLYYPCKEHGSDYIHLVRKKKDSLLTWKVVCKKCEIEKIKNPIDIFRFKCHHKDNNGNKICNKEPTKFKPLTIREGGIYTSYVITIVDIPHAEYIDLDDLEYVMLGLYLNKFNEIFKKEINLKEINHYFHQYDELKVNNDVNIFEHLEKFLEELKILLDKLRIEIMKLKTEYSDVNLENLNDYFAIKGIFEEEKLDEEYSKMNFDKFILSQKDSTKQKILSKNYDNLKGNYGIENITYISNINLISSSIGVINGINRYYDQKFVPHFNPIWEDKDKEIINVYSYPFETEGILIDLDKIKVCEWLIKNKIINANIPKTIHDASEILLKLEEDSREYENLKTLLHTLSHTLLIRSSLHTGLDTDSCGELIFVNSAAILVYSTSDIKTGGFSFVFEHSLFDWFREAKLDISDCTFDPTCIHEKGVCLSCIYLPEFVCSEFNKNLDRDVLIGTKKRYEFGYW